VPRERRPSRALGKHAISSAKKNHSVFSESKEEGTREKRRGKDQKTNLQVTPGKAIPGSGELAKNRTRSTILASEGSF